LEICCNGAAERRKKLPAMIAKFTGEPEADALAFLDAVEADGFTFAPASFAQVSGDLGGSLVLPSLTDVYHNWMEHEELVFAPASFSAVIQDIATIVRKRAVNGGAQG